MNKIKLLLADDHPLIREGFKGLLGTNETFEIVGQAETGQELVEMISQTTPDIVLVDISMPRLNGLDAMMQIKKTNNQIKFIVLTMHEEREYILDAIKKGANGYLLKNIDRAELERAIHLVYEGGNYYSAFVTNILAASVIKQESGEQAEITPREKEVLKLVAAGFSTKQIADKLDISFRTVESHRINMLKKMKVSNTAELIKLAMELKMI